MPRSLSSRLQDAQQRRRRREHAQTERNNSLRFSEKSGTGSAPTRSSLSRVDAITDSAPSPNLSRAQQAQRLCRQREAVERAAHLQVDDAESARHGTYASAVTDENHRRWRAQQNRVRTFLSLLSMPNSIPGRLMWRMCTPHVRLYVRHFLFAHSSLMRVTDT